MTHPTKIFAFLVTAVGLVAGCANSHDMDGTPSEPPYEYPPDAWMPDADTGPPDAREFEFPPDGSMPDGHWPPPPDSGLDAEPPPDAGPPPVDAGEPADLGCEAGRSLVCTCSDRRVGEQLCTSDGLFEPCACAGEPVGPSDLLLYRFQRITEGMVGGWTGVFDSPWEGVQPIDIIFREDGTYWTRDYALEWGPQPPGPHHYQTVDIYASGTVHGDIQLWPTYERIPDGILDRIELSEDGNELTFEVWLRDRGHGGPPVARLHRTR